MDVAQLTADTVHENQKATSLDQMLAAGGPATNAAVVFSALAGACSTLVSDKEIKIEQRGGNPGGAMATVLMTSIGDGPVAHLIFEDLERHNVALVDCTDYEAEPVEQKGKIDFTPTLSTIMVNAKTGARTVASTNTRLPVKAEFVTQTLEAMGEPQVLLVDGHNPEVGMAALTYGTGYEASIKDGSGDDPFGAQEAKPSYLRILDGGSWKPWLPPMLGFIDVAILSADFMPPGATSFEDTVQFLRGFGIERVIQTAGSGAVRWSWLGNEGEAMPPSVDTVCTLAAGDTFHGAFAWGCARGIVTRETQDPGLLVDFSNRIAALSTTVFGTRSWLDDHESIDHEVKTIYTKHSA